MANVDKRQLEALVSRSQQRAGLRGRIYREGDDYRASRADYSVARFLKKERAWNPWMVLGHSRLSPARLIRNWNFTSDSLSIPPRLLPKPALFWLAQR